MGDPAVRPDHADARRPRGGGGRPRAGAALRRPGRYVCGAWPAVRAGQDHVHVRAAVRDGGAVRHAGGAAGGAAAQPSRADVSGAGHRMWSPARLCQYYRNGSVGFSESHSSLVHNTEYGLTESIFNTFLITFY